MYIQQPYLKSPVTWRPPMVSELPRWPRTGRIGLDTETRDPLLFTLGPGVRRGGYIVGVSFAFGGRGWYLPVRHESKGNLAEEHVLQYLKDQVLEFRGEIVGANLPYDLDYLAERGIEFHESVKFRDVLIAAPLLNELHLSYSLDNVARRAGIGMKDTGELVDVGRRWGLGWDEKDMRRQLWKLPSYHVGAYAEHDAVLPLLLLEKQEKEMQNQGLEYVWELETDNLPVALAMRRRGVRIDRKRLQEISDWAAQIEEEEFAKVRTETGVNVQFGDAQKAELLSKALAEIGIKCPLTKKTKKPSVTAGLLQAHPHPVTDAILRAKQFAKLRTTFCQQVWDHMIGDRVHCTFNQVKTQKPGSDDSKGAAWGRWSSTDFNIQNQPIRNKEYGKLWRSIYIPDEGMIWACSDFSSQEPRLTVHFATLMEYSGARTTAQCYWENPMMDPHSATAAQMFREQWEHLGPFYEMGPEEGGKEFLEAERLRAASKTLFLGLSYGMGGGKLCRQLGLPTVRKDFTSSRTGEFITYQAPGPEGERLLNQFHKRVPYVKMLSDECKKRAQSRGWVKTLSGRRCRFRRYKGELLELHKALNRVIQGSAGDQMKEALRKLHKAGIPIQLTVHDEVDWSAKSEEEMREVAHIMTRSVKLLVPSKVDVEWGKSWGELNNKLSI